MSIEATLLRILRHRSKYSALHKAVPMGALDLKCSTILKDYGDFLKEFPQMEEIRYADFSPWFFGFQHPKLNDETRSTMQAILRQMEGPVDKSIEEGLMPRLLAVAKADETAKLLTRFQDGDEFDFYDAMSDLIEDYSQALDRRVTVPWINTAIEDILAEDDVGAGLEWRWECLNRSMRPLRGGDFGILAMRPDKGKTTAIADNITHMAKQVELYKPGGEILWFNNEGPGKRIYQRIYQAALNAKVSQLVQWSKEASTTNKKNMLRQLYDEAVGGRWDVIKVIDIHDMFHHEVEYIIKQHNAALMIFDMIDNIKFGGGLANGGTRTDQMLEAMYQWGRNSCVKYDSAGIATSQISGDGDGVEYPGLAMLKDSKTGKQGASDFIITGGAKNDPSYEDNRYIGTTKNKLHREGGPKNPRTEMILDGPHARFIIPHVEGL